jgi:hypothetical protein
VLSPDLFSQTLTITSFQINEYGLNLSLGSKPNHAFTCLYSVAHEFRDKV